MFKKDVVGSLVAMAAAMLASACGPTPDPVRPGRVQASRQGSAQDWASAPGPLDPRGRECQSLDIQGPAFVEAIKPAVVRIETDLHRGTGFIVQTPRGEIIIITAFHVIREGHKFSAFVPVGSEEAEISGLQIAKIDLKYDLALLRAPRLAALKGLYLNPEGVRIGQTVGAPGFPGLGSAKAALTFGKGMVSAPAVEMNSHKIMLADVPVNPGNSGGPIVDGCGAVVGVVVGTRKDLDRVQIIIPVEQVVRLYEDYIAPRPPMPEAVRARLAGFERALEAKHGDEVAAYFTVAFLEADVREYLKFRIGKYQELLARYKPMLDQAGIGPDTPPEQVYEAVIRFIPPAELAAFKPEANTLTLMSAGRQHEALEQYLSTFIVMYFGDFQGLKVDAVTDVTETSATARVAMTINQQISIWSLQLVMDRGDLRINVLECMRNCPWSRAAR